MLAARPRGATISTPEDRPVGDELEVVVQHALIEALQEREHELAEAQRVAHLGSWSWDLTSGNVTWSDELFRIFGVTPQEFTPTYEAFLSRVAPDHVARVKRIIDDALETKTPFDYECPIPFGLGQQRVLHCRGDVVTDATGVPIRMHGTAQDITEWTAAQEALAASERHLAALTQAVTEIVFLYEPDGTQRFSTARLEEALGYPTGSQLEVDPWQLVHPDDVESFRIAILQLQAEAGATMTTEFRALHADGSWRTLEARGRNATDDPNIQSTFVTTRDVTGIRAAVAVLSRHAFADPLTGLANRGALTDRAEAALARARRNGWATAMLAIDLDGFRQVNDEFGHAAGDQVLVEVAQRLDRIFRPYDAVARSYDTVARLGGDEFLVVCERVADARVAQTLGDRVRDAIAASMDLPAGPAKVTAAVGVALAASWDTDVEGLVRRAEAAMRHAKRQGPGVCEVFAAGLVDADAARVIAVGELALALERDELRLLFQPKVALDTGRITGVEALLRWEHPERGTVPPLDFIPLAESSGLIIPIGAWVIGEACRQNARWLASSPGRALLAMAVNVSSRQFGPDLVGVVADALASTGLDASTLCLEVTETILMTDVPAAISTLQELAGLGVSVSIDDFGTGYSSLAYLKRLPLDELKIDKSFVDGLGVDPNDTAIVAAVIAMAHALDLRVIAEGVETRDQMEHLRTLGCEQAQGYYYARPGTAEAVDALLAAEAAASWQSHAQADVAAADTAIYRPERVLVIDDTEDVRQLARMSLAAVGFEVHEADSGTTGISAARDLLPDCILLDLVMPDMSGFDVCRALRADEVTAECTILMLTANADAEDKIQAYECGADDYIIKPFSPRDLASRVRSAIGRRGGST